MAIKISARVPSAPQTKTKKPSERVAFLAGNLRMKACQLAGRGPIDPPDGGKINPVCIVPFFCSSRCVNYVTISKKSVTTELPSCLTFSVFIKPKINSMKPSAPSKYVWIGGMIFGIAGIIGHFVYIDFLTSYSFPFLLAGFVLLAAGTSVNKF